MTEAQVKLAFIQPILRALDWDDSDPNEFDPEFPVPEGNVDYALLRAPDSPLVFIEAKRPGGVDVKAEEQLFRYANNKGVPFLILTDGNLWDFYLSMAAGDPPDRQFYRVELTNEERISEYVESLEMYLRKNRVVSEDARRDAEQRLKSNRERGGSAQGHSEGLANPVGDSRRYASRFACGRGGESLRNPAEAGGC